MLFYLQLYFPSFIAAVVLLLTGMVFLSILKKRMNERAAMSQDPTLNAFLANCAYIVLVAIIIIMTLTLLGVPTTALITVLGAASLAVGLALKEFLSNVAAGFVLIFLRPFKVGDTVTLVGNVTGKVVEINLFVTQLDTQSNEAVFVPNSQLLNTAIVNKTRYTWRQLDLRFTVGHDVSVSQVKTILEQAALAHPAVHKTPAPMTAVAELTETNAVILLRIWVDSAMLQKVQFELTETIKSIFDETGIQMNNPHMNITIRSKPATLLE